MNVGDNRWLFALEISVRNVELFFTYRFHDYYLFIIYVDYSEGINYRNVYASLRKLQQKLSFLEIVRYLYTVNLFRIHAHY